jgi:hypothetical protein
VVYRHLASLQYAREDFSAQREPIDALYVPAVMLLYVVDDLRGLVVYGGEVGLLAERETVYLRSHNVEMLFEQPYQWQENLVRHPKAGDEHYRGLRGRAIVYKIHM